MPDYYGASGDPATSSSGSSSVMRAELTAIALAFTKVAAYTGAANRVAHNNAGGTAQTNTSGFTFDGTTFTAPVITTPGALSTTLVTDSTSISTGALKTAGGLGVTKALWVGGLSNIAGPATFQGTVDTTGLRSPTSNVKLSVGNDNASAAPSVGYNFTGTGVSGVYNYNASDVASRIGFSSGGMQFFTASSGTAGNAITFTERLTLSASNFSIAVDTQIATKTPASAGATGTAGTVAWDDSFIYVATATNTWKRSAISTW